MTCKTKCHRQALKDVIELTIIGGLLALTADCAWLAHDIYENGLSVWYVIVGTGLLGGTILTSVALYWHHQNNVKTIVKQLLAHKLHVQRTKTERLQRRK